MAVEPLAGKRTVQVTDRRTRIDWANFIGKKNEIEMPQKSTGDLLPPTPGLS
jgi:hypothetical protein